MPTIVVDAVPDDFIDVEPEPRAEEAGAGRGGARWRVVAAWARWERGGLLSHLEEDDLNTLRDAFAAAAPAAELVRRRRPTRWRRGWRSSRSSCVLGETRRRASPPSPRPPGY